MFQGYLLKIKDKDTFFNKFMQLSTYDGYIIKLDVDSFTANSGETFRTVAPHESCHVEFQTPVMNNTKQEEFMDAISSAYTNTDKRELDITFWCPERGRYETKHVYLVEPHFKIKKIEKDKLTYMASTIEFIGL